VRLGGVRDRPCGEFGRLNRLLGHIVRRSSNRYISGHVRVGSPRQRLHRLTVLLVLLSALMATPALAQQEQAGPDSAHVFLMRGFMNVFSLGLDEFAETLKRNGIRADVYNHVLAPLVVRRAASEFKSGRTRTIILIGHSMGVAAVIQILGDLGRLKVPVALAITLASGSLTIPSGYAHEFIHMYTSSGGPLIPGPDFHGHLTNLNMSDYPGVDHLTIDKDQIVQSMLLGYINRTIRSESAHVSAAAGRTRITAPPRSRQN
jgi:hypothetical protein